MHKWLRLCRERYLRQGSARGTRQRPVDLNLFQPSSRNQLSECRLTIDTPGHSCDCEHARNANPAIASLQKVILASRLKTKPLVELVTSRWQNKHAEGRRRAEVDRKLQYLWSSTQHRRTYLPVYRSYTTSPWISAMASTTYWTWTASGVDFIGRW